MIKHAISCVLLLLIVVSSSFAAQQATLFVYHRFGDQRYPSTNIDVDVFANQLHYLQQNHYNVLSVSDIVQRLSEGRALPPHCVAITVDDAYKSFLTGAMPLLRQYNYPVTLFVSSASVGYGSYLDWDQLRNLQSEGVEIGNHSDLHPYFVSEQMDFPDGWREKARLDLQRSQQIFKTQLGCAPTVFAYPYGEYSPALEQLLREIGFVAAFAQQSGVVDASAFNASRFHLPRFPMGGGFATLSGFMNKAAMRHLPVTVVSPQTPIIKDDDPPELIVEIDRADILVSTLRCYVQGQDNAVIEAIGGGRYKVRAAEPLSGRRNKYTLTAQGRDGKTWYWFSQLWIHP